MDATPVEGGGDPLRVLLIEDSDSDARLVTRELARLERPVRIERVSRGDEVAPALLGGTWDLVLSDWSMPRFSAQDALALIKEHGLDVPFLVVSGTIGEETAVEAMRAGAHDYVLKDRLGRLRPAIERELRRAREHHHHMVDVAERRRTEEVLRRTEEQLRHAQKMEAVGSLAGGVAHDFNNLLTVIVSYGETVIDDLPAHSAVREDVREILAAARRATDLTRQLLLFSRHQLVEPRVLRLDELLEGMEKMLRRLVGEDVLLSLACDAGAPLTILADPGHIEQLVMNLAVNARDAMPRGGRLTLETRRVTLDEEFARQHVGSVPGEYVMLAVTDTGVGIDEAIRARIFEPFFTTKERGKGTGLGLSTVFGIVKQAGGTIWVYSEPGQGTSFKVYLPLHQGAPIPREASRSVTELHGSETILLVEDDEQVRAVARMLLERGGYHVVQAASPAEALEQLGAAGSPRIDLLLTDLVMPGMSGIDLARLVAERWPAVKLLCMSGYTDDTVVRHGIVDGGTPFLQKPFSRASLARKVREVLDAR